jgi:hypothetical protein
MTQHRFAFLTATAFATIALPAMAQDGPPPPPAGVQTPAWVDPQVPVYPGGAAAPQAGERARPDRAGAPFAHPLPPEGRRHGPAYPAGPEYGYGYAYPAGSAPVPCGCGGYAYPPVTWVPIQIETHYRYSAPIRQEKNVVEEKVVEENVTETKTVPVHRSTKYVKAPRQTKQTKRKVIRKTK